MLSLESGKRKFVINLRTQIVSEEMASESGSDKEIGGMDEGRDRMEPSDEGVLELEGCSEDDLDSLNRKRRAGT